LDKEIKLVIYNSIIFFIFILLVAFILVPTNRELGKLFFRINDFQSAKNYLKDQFIKDQDDVFNLKRYLQVLYEQRENYKFEKISNIFLDKNSNNLEINNIVAKYNEDNMQLEKAVKYWKKIFFLNPNDENIFSKILNYYEFNKNYDEIIEVCEYKKANGHFDLKDFYYLGNIYLRKREIKKAEKLYFELLKKYPKEKDVFFYLEYIYSYLGEQEKLINILQKIYSNENDEYFSIKIVDILIQTKKYDEAITQLNVFYNKTKNIEYLKYLYDINLNVKKDLAESEKLLYILVKKYPKKYFLDFRYLAELFYQKGNLLKSMKFLEIYHEHFKGDYLSHNLLGDIYASLGFSDRSKAEYKKAIKDIELQRSKL
jgi:tetratricopeptide (TPR) repeat protein